MESSLLEEQKISLDDLLKVDETGFSKIAGLKNISNSKRPKKIKESMLDFQLIARIYQSITTLLRALNLHIDTVKHYATWVRKASLFQISQLQSNKRYLYLICFITHQYKLRQDIFADILLTCVQATQNSVIKKDQKEQVFKQKDQQKETLQLLSEARISHKALLKTIETLTNSLILPDSEKILQIKQLLEDYHQQTSKYYTEPKLDALLKHTMDKIDVQNYYRTVEDLSLKLQNRVADILRNIAFDTTDNQNIPDIMLAIQHYQVKVGNIGKEAPINYFRVRLQYWC